jgi:hypothetical protein
MQRIAVRKSRDLSTSFLAGLTLYEERADKGDGLTDCISVETMHREG